MKAQFLAALVVSRKIPISSSFYTHFDIHNYITFSSSNTRSSSQFKLNHRLTNNNLTRHSYFYRLPRLWNSLPSINSSLSMRTIKSLIHTHTHCRNMARLYVTPYRNTIRSMERTSYVHNTIDVFTLPSL